MALIKVVVVVVVTSSRRSLTNTNPPQLKYVTSLSGCSFYSQLGKAGTRVISVEVVIDQVVLCVHHSISLFTRCLLP